MKGVALGKGSPPVAFCHSSPLGVPALPMLQASLMGNLPALTGLCDRYGCLHGVVIGYISTMSAPCRIQSSSSSSPKLILFIYLNISTFPIHLQSISVYHQMFSTLSRIFIRVQQKNVQHVQTSCSYA